MHRFSKSMALYILPTFIKDRPRLGLTICMTPHKDDETSHRLSRTSEGQIRTYEKAVNVLYKSNAADFNTSKSLVDSACSKNSPKENSVQFADVL